jgi:hypothetical protein
LKTQISLNAYANIDDRFSKDVDKLTLLCILFDTELNATDMSETIKFMFDKIKTRISDVIDLNNPQKAVPEKLDASDLNMNAPEEEVARDVIQRLILLFEIKPATNYQ